MRHEQQGVTLVVGLIFLVFLTVLAVSALKLVNMNATIALNAQLQKEAEMAAQKVIDDFVSSAANFTTPPASAQSFDVDLNNDSSNDYSVTVSAMDTNKCLDSRPASGFSATFAGAPNENTWEVTATAQDARSTYGAGLGSRVEVHQGVKIRVDSSLTCP